MHDGQAYGQGLAQVVNDEFTALGGEVVAFQAITPGESDYSAALADIASKQPQALYFGGYTAEAVVHCQQMKQSGLTASSSSAVTAPSARTSSTAPARTAKAPTPPP